MTHEAEEMPMDDEEQRREIGRRIAEGYRRFPQQPDESDEMTEAMIAEEPWPVED